MFKNYLTVAIRNIIKEKSHLAINLFGLTVGLMGFVLANIFADYEESYDSFFKDHERIHVVYSKISPSSGLGIPEINGVNSAFAPVYKAENPDALMARFYNRETVVRKGELQVYANVQFVDPEFLEIFQMELIEGELANALDRPDAAIITEQTAERFFGEEPALGKTLTLASKVDLEVVGIIRDMPANSHFSFSIVSDANFGILASVQAWTQISDDTIEGTWSDLRTSDRTYIKLATGETTASMSDAVDVVYQRHAPEKQKEFVSNLFLRPVVEANLLIWQVTGIPGMAVLRVLGAMILGIAAINFVNLATAQAMGRAREVGIRKTLGARPWQLVTQFLTEAVVVSFLALLLALAAIEYLVPVINSALDKSVSFSPLTDPGTMLFLVSTALVVGLLSGSYPAFLLARLPSSAALSAEMKSGKRAGLLRKILVVTQFGFSIFLVVSGLVIYSQNRYMQDQDYGFYNEDMIVIQRMRQDGIRENYKALKDEISRLP
ncbi:MAG: FtsX-like permease family protein, partial [Sphingomonadales bacterium]